MELSFTACQAVRWDLFYLRGGRDDAEGNAPFSRLLQYGKGIQPGGRDWAYIDYGFRIGDMTLHRLTKVDARILCAVGEPGIVVSPDPAFPDQKIIDSTLEWQKPYRLGRLTRISDIDGVLYAVGEGGQNYRMHEGIWVMVDKNIFREAIAPDWDKDFFPPGWSEGGSKSENTYLLENPDVMRRHTKRLVEVYKDNLIYGINGPNANAIYICGKDGLLSVRTDEEGFRPIAVRTAGRLLDIAVEDEDTIWVCGEGGVLLRGNARQGFQPAPGIGGDQTFRRMAIFRGRLYLASSDGPRGLFVHDGNRLRQVASGLVPEIGALSSISATDEVLLVVGHKEIVRFDGTTWDRMSYPANDP